MLVQRAQQPGPARPAPQRPLLAVVREHFTIEIPGVVRDVDVDRWQAALVPPGFSARVHTLAPLQRGSPTSLLVWN